MQKGNNELKRETRLLLMKRIMKHYLLLSIALLWVPENSFCLVVGSNTVPSRQSTVNFPAADPDNEMRGFAVFEQGFSLENSSTTCLYNDFFPISGNMTLNNGILTLSKDLKLGNTAQFINAGELICANHKVEIPTTIAPFILSGSFIFEDIILILNAPVTISGTITFQGKCIVEGRFNTIDCSSGTVAIDTESSVHFKDLALKDISAGTIYCVDSVGTMSLQDVTWIQDGNYSFTQGAIDVLEGETCITGTYVFVYQSNQVSTIKSNATLLFDSGMTFSYASTVARNLLAMEDEFSILHLYETTLYSIAPGLQLTKGTLVIDGECTIESGATTHDDGITLGDGSSASNNITLKILPESGPNASTGWFNYKNVG